MATSILITGGAGYIGSHALVEFLAAGYRPIVVDNFCNSSPDVLRRVEALTGFPVVWHRGDVRDEGMLNAVFSQARQEGMPIDCVVHFAGLKAVGESVAQPLDYYDNNVHGSVVLLRAMDRAQVKRIVFSSSATVYGEPLSLPYTESHPLAPANPYGRTKAMVEAVLADWCASDAARTAVNLRYFNPIGAHPSGKIGESPRGTPNNLFPYITQVAVGKRAKLSVFGNDYPTSDGTGVRDYLHVSDLAMGHVKAVEYASRVAPGCFAFNLGTGRGTSVLELIRTFETATGRPVPYEILARRPGDVAQMWADPTAAHEKLGWWASRSIEDMCRDGWRWQSQNPDGYAECPTI
ncbi:UDP-glucose 4-epimerase GalE [Pigmentiphaga sp. NML080357]|uniref:UDP-glucose 4-epimerase GalE n=1 Tax=Pigmentiphaga sp. NML080357 TaxID=2008675 RepID=UPI000B414B13|nr:UDP-glucose 4-epimerase GalE [Pigmentiphaga sp. NML080357]OVZ60994.1 UDP-glucose 4-epimerase GalE [Pigmentiphaga sp. NML080357]